MLGTVWEDRSADHHCPLIMKLEHSRGYNATRIARHDRLRRNANERLAKEGSPLAVDVENSSTGIMFRNV